MKPLHQSIVRNFIVLVVVFSLAWPLDIWRLALLVLVFIVNGFAIGWEIDRAYQPKSET